jgi:ketosteroid isomerase-like protein
MEGNMGSEENAELVRRGYAAFNAGDMETLTELFDENATWHTPGESPIAGDYQGRDAAFTQFGRYGGDTGGTFQAELQYVLTDDDDHAVGVQHAVAERNGKTLDVDGCILFELKDGKVVSGREYFFDLNAWDEFWS